MNDLPAVDEEFMETVRANGQQFFMTDESLKLTIYLYDGNLYIDNVELIQGAH
jgi:hypothetical protein